MVTLPSQSPRLSPGSVLAAKTAEARNDDIEVLRAIAIALVVVCHFVWQSMPTAGGMAARIEPYFGFWSGVDLFFCVSGFVITTSLLSARRRVSRNGGIRTWIVPFYIRRAFRLLPSAWLWVGVTLLCTVFLNAHGQFGYLRENLFDGIAAIAEVYNFYAYHCSLQQDCGLMGHYWSLSLEEQFYLAFPLLLLAVPRLRYLVMILAIGFVIQFVQPRAEGFFISHSLLWFTRTDAIILGVLIAMWREHGNWSYAVAEPVWHRRRPIAIAFLAFCIALLTVLPSPRLAAFQYATGSLALVSAYLVYAASYNRNYLLRGSRLKRTLVWIGARSYSIYLVHIPIYHALKEASDYAFGQSSVRLLGPAYAGFFLLGAVLVTVAIAHWNFRFLETPIRDRGRLLASRYQERLTRRDAVQGAVAAAN